MYKRIDGEPLHLTCWCRSRRTFERSPAGVPPRSSAQQLTSQQEPFHRHVQGGRIVPCFAKLSPYWWPPRLKLATADGQPMTRPNGNERQKNPVLSASDRKLGPMSTMDCLCQINGYQLRANITLNTFSLCWTLQIINVATVLSSAWDCTTDEVWLGDETTDRTQTLKTTGCL